jgi:hypothetical protein
VKRPKRAEANPDIAAVAVIRSRWMTAVAFVNWTAILKAELKKSGNPSASYLPIKQLW